MSKEKEEEKKKKNEKGEEKKTEQTEQNQTGILVVLRYFWKQSVQYPRYFTALIIGRTLPLIANILMPLILKDMVDMMSRMQPEVALPLLVHKWRLWTLLSVGSWFARRIFDAGTIGLESRVMKNLYQQAFDYLQRHSFSFFSKTFSGSLVRKVGKLARGYENLVDTLVFDFYPALLLTAVRITVLWMVNRKIGAVFVVWMIIHCITQFFLFRRKFIFDKKANEADSTYTGHLADAIGNNATITAFGSYAYERDRFAQATNSWMRVVLKARRKWPMIGMISGVLILFAQSLVVWVMVQGWGEGVLSLGAILLIQMYGMATFDILFGIGNTFKRLYQTVADAGEMLEIMQTPHDIVDHTNDKIQVTQGRIVFDQVSFSYRENKIVFDDFSLVIKPGEKVAFVGESGAGKSSITKLLLRFYDIQKGKILIDDHDISQVTQASLRQSISFVAQDPILFHRSLKDNIGYGNPEASFEEIVAAAKMARCHEFIMRSADGYETLVGERGILLSGGERQRITIARAILANRKILVLDEATSSLDSESETYIQEAMQEVMKNKTTIVIAHRLSTIMRMDRIIVLEKGRVVESGSHKELLLQKNGIYARLRNLQSGGFVA